MTAKHHVLRLGVLGMVLSTVVVVNAFAETVSPTSSELGAAEFFMTGRKLGDLLGTL